ncbi:TPA: nucleobase:cation symporter-2 family protein [Streptococcus pneumoniae]|nr:xanthine permease [Streptococcus pneumoniae]
MQTQEKHSQAAVLGLQHLLAMYSGSILVPIMIATALGYSAEQLTYLISTDIFMCGVATFLQLQLNKYFGIGLPVVLGVAFQSVAPLIMIGQSHGSGAMFGALIASGIYVVLVSGIFSKVANLFPSIVTGSVITTIGLTLIPVAIGNMGNNVPEPTGQSLLLSAITVLLLSAITVLIILLINIFTKGFIKSISILIGLVVGTAIAATMGLVDFSPVAVAPLVHVPTPLYFGMPTFEISSIVMMCIIATVSMVESTGVYLALSDITKDPIDSTRLRNGYRAEGLAVLLGGIFNTFPYTGFSQNVGLVKLSGIKKRLPIYYAAGFLVLLGLLPKFGALAQIIPSSVLGGAMLVMFGFVSIQGMQILARVDFANNEHNFLIAAVSIAAGVGLNNSNLFVSMPTAFQMFFSNGIVVASLLAIVLNAVLNHKKK